MTAIADRLASARDRRRTRRLGFTVAVVVGLAVAAVHWVGLFLGGALAGLFARNLPRAVAAGVAFGLVALVAFAAWLGVQGAVGVYLETGQLLAVSVAIPVGAGAVGALVRGLV